MIVRLPLNPYVQVSKIDFHLQDVSQNATIIKKGLEFTWWSVRKRDISWSRGKHNKTRSSDSGRNKSIGLCSWSGKCGRADYQERGVIDDSGWRAR